jgi:hypothetical protein
MDPFLFPNYPNFEVYRRHPGCAHAPEGFLVKWIAWPSSP